MAIDFKKLLEDPRLRALYLEDACMEEAELAELLDVAPTEAWERFFPNAVLVVHYRSISEGSFGVYEWGGLYFAVSPDEDLVEGPFEGPANAASVIFGMSLSDCCETDHIEYTISSTLEEFLSLQIVQKLVGIGGQFTLNSVVYRREVGGFVRV